MTDDRMLAWREEGSGPPLLIAHGLFGSARNWGGMIRRLSSGRRVVAVDMRNHGASFRDPEHGYAEQAQDLARVITALGGQADVLGHSMGGKAAMVLALTRPEMIGKLIVLDIAPITYGHSHLPLIAAMQALPLDRITSRGEADRALAAAVPDPGTRAFLLQSLDFAPAGPVWRLNLAALAANMAAITGFPACDGAFPGPALFLTGENSTYVDSAGRLAIARYFPGSRLETIAGAGHWLHADSPGAVADRAGAFLTRDP